MFVQDNSVQSVLLYFKEKLSDKFSASEIKVFTSLCFFTRFNWTKSDLLLSKDKTVSESDLLWFRTVVKALLAGNPIQYILGQTEFCDLIFKVNENVLIPRPETEELVYIVKEEKEGRILDIGTGSGCIPISLKKFNNKSEVVGLDVSEDALEIARENAKNHNLEVTFILDDILNPKIEQEPFDIIVSNPPYVLQSDAKEMKKNVLNFEPHLALFVEDNDPLLFYRMILEYSQKNLKSGGKVYFEIHESMGIPIKQLFLDFGFVEIQIKKDFYGKDRFGIAIKK